MERSTRLRKRREFQRVYREGVKVAGEYLVVFGLPAAQEHWRLGVTTTRKLGGAVVRNRARRRIRELFRRHGQSLAGAGDLVVNARHGAAAAPWPALEKDWIECLLRLGRRLSRRG